MILNEEGSLGARQIRGAHGNARLLALYWVEPVVLASNRGFSPIELNTIRQLLRDNRSQHWRHGMKTAATIVEPRIAELRVTESEITAVADMIDV